MNEYKRVKRVLQQPDKKKAVEELNRINLTKKERETVELLFFSGATIERAAELLQVSPSTVSNWKKNAMEKCAAVFLYEN